MVQSESVLPWHRGRFGRSWERQSRSWWKHGRLRRTGDIVTLVNQPAREGVDRDPQATGRPKQGWD